MTDLAAIAGTYADLRQVKSRGVWQLVVEIPAEHAERLVEMFGLPRQDEPQWLGVIRLNSSPRALIPGSGLDLPSSDGVSVVPDGSRVAPKPMRADEPALGETKTYTLANRIGMTCNNPAFREWLYRAEGIGGDGDVAYYVRLYCNVKSRAEILPGTDAAARWSVLETQYLADTGQLPEVRG
jgi:hypothetical protein